VARDSRVAAASPDLWDLIAAWTEGSLMMGFIASRVGQSSLHDSVAPGRLVP
jgi:hypothetical protein